VATYHVANGGERTADVVKGYANKLERQVVKGNHAHKDNTQGQNLR
jgi:hypothetical protein